MYIHIKREKNILFTDKIFAFLFAVSPILFNYRGLVANAAITLLILMFPYEIMKLFSVGEIRKSSLMLLMPLVAYWGFKIIDHGTSATEIGQVGIYFVLMLMIASDPVIPKLLIRYATLIACIAAGCIILQYVCYYVLGFHLQLVPTSLLLDSADQWVKLAQTGRVSVTGKTIAFYRPSAFFLEPSHMFTYLIAPLTFALLSEDSSGAKKRIAIFLSLGMICSTSGMGILATGGLWMLYLAKKGGKDNRIELKKLLNPRIVLLFIGLFAVAVVLYFKVSFFRRSVLRIFSSGDDYSNAVTGRVASGSQLIGSLRGRQLILGISDHYSDLEFHMTGFNATMYKYGLVGTLLSYLFYLQSLLKLKGKYFWLSALLIVMSFFNPHTHGTVYMLFFSTFLLDGFSGRFDEAGDKVPECKNIKGGKKNVYI